MIHFVFIGILAISLLNGCSLLSFGGSSDNKKSDEPQKAATTVDGMIKEGPGKFAGDQFDEEKVKVELLKFPKNLTADEVYDRLIWLFAEDYEAIVKEAEALKPHFTISKLGDYDPNTQDPEELLKPENEKKPTQIAIVIDASGSMAGKVNGKVKMDEAKKAVREFARSLPEQTKVSLRVYGHKGSNQEKDKQISCTSTEEIYGLNKYDSLTFESAVNQLRPVGWTPLAAAIRGAGEDLRKNHTEANNIVYVVSDGLETCGGDPVKEAKDLHQSDVQAVVNIIGFDLDAKSKQVLEEVAKAGGGSFTSASSSEEIKKQMKPKFDIWRGNEINHWKLRNLSSLNEQEGKYRQKIYDLTHWFINHGESKFLLAREREKERIKWALQFLEENQKISKEFASEFGEVYKKAQNRFILIDQYRDRLQLKKIEEMEKERIKVYEKILEIEKIETQKAYNKNN